jgi:predicted amidohydrolase YtcJ
MKILYGVPIYTMDGRRSVEESVVIGDGVVKFTGAFDVARRLYPRAEKVDLQFGCILPGFIDAHLHLKEYSLLFRELDLTGVMEQKEVLDMLQACVSTKKENEWIVGAGVDSGVIDQLSSHILDDRASSNPVVLYSTDLHTAVVNSRALQCAQIDVGRPDPLGGLIERDDSGAPNGVLRERAIELIKKAIPAEKTRKTDEALERGMRLLMSSGITALCDCSVHTPESSITSIMKIWRKGNMKMRAVLMFSDRDTFRLGNLGIPSQFGNERVLLGGCKLIVDGSLTSQTAYMSRTYAGKTGSGMLLMSESELYDVLKRSHSHYIWSAVHAIGDRANRMVLDVYEKLKKEVGIPSVIRRIEHAQTLQDEDISRFAEIGVLPIMNPVHLPMDREKALKFFGPDARLLYRMGSLLASGAVIGFGSNAPVAPVHPLRGIYAASERKDFHDGPQLRFFPKERITLEDAVYGYTMGSATAIGLEKKIGSLETGKYADIVHLSKDILRDGAESLADAVVLRTIIGGETAFEKTASS